MQDLSSTRSCDAVPSGTRPAPAPPSAPCARATSSPLRCASAQIETLKEAASKGIGLRVLRGQRSASCYTSDFSPAGIDRLVNDALAMARYTSEDPAHGLPEPESMGQAPGDLKLYCNDVDSLSVEERIDLARRGERSAFDTDPRIRNSDGANFEAASGHRIFANSCGFVGEYRRSYCSLSVVPIAEDERRGHAARLLVLGLAQPGRPRKPGRDRSHGGRTRPPPAERAQDRDPPRPGDLRSPLPPRG